MTEKLTTEKVMSEKVMSEKVMSEKRELTRRTILRGVGVGVCLPLLEALQTATAWAVEPASKRAASKVRMAFLYFPNGVAEGTWQPRRFGAAGELLELSDWMRPLEPFKKDIVIPQKLWTPRGNGHGAGTATWLTGAGYDGRAIDAGGVSVDQLAAQSIGQETLLPSLELSLRGEGYFSKNLPRNNISWTSGTTPASREVEPRVVFDRMFRTSGHGTVTSKSVLDLVLANAKRLRARVSVRDRRKIDEYLTSVRSIERRIDFAERRSVEARADRALTDSLVRPRPGIPLDHQEYVRLMLDMIVLAFWSGATRIATFMLDHGQSNRYFNFIEGVEGTWHALSHYKDASGRTEDDDGKTSWTSVSSKRDMYSAVNRWHHEQVAYLLGRMKEIDDDDGTLLDNSMILYGSSLGDGHEHGETDLPILLAGRGGGTIHTGRALRFRRDTNLANLYLSMLQRMGVKAESFGDSTGPMSELESWRRAF